jgi:serine/threonine protein kinase
LARMHVEDRPPSLRKKRPDLSRRFERIVMKCLAKHPDDRYRDAARLLADVRAMRDGPASRTRWVFIAAAAGALLALVALALRSKR